MDVERVKTQESSADLPTKASAIRRALEVHKGWLEQQLCVPLSDTVVLETELDLTQIGPERVLDLCDDLKSVPTRTLRRLRIAVAAAEIPTTTPPLLEIDDGLTTDDLSYMLDGLKPKRNAYLHWGDSPLALRFHLHGTVIIAINVPYFTGPGTSQESIARLIVARRDAVAEVMKQVEFIARRDSQPRICVQDGPTRRIANCNWDDLVLDQNVLKLVRDDFESFFERESFFRKNRLPFRRGYLLHGSPGNGKTSVVRAMLSSRGMTAHTLRLFEPQRSDGDLDRLFEDAIVDRPSMILLEDLDRAFPRSGESRTNISMQALLNALDGIGTGEGIVVVATANEPTLLDPAILKRPGRFDRVVHFPNPCAELRMRYLLKFNPAIDAQALEQPVGESNGFSFAQLREAVILAAQSAFERKADDINADDLLHAIRALRQTNVRSSVNNKFAGFESRDLGR
jgi:hypothetical protein